MGVPCTPTKLYVWNCYHGEMHLGRSHKHIGTTFVRSVLVVPIFYLAHGLFYAFCESSVYVSTEKPSKNFKLVIQYIMQVYVPLWFAIKFQSNIARAEFHVFEAVRRSRTLPQEVQDIVLPVVERNAYGAHVESILCSMIADEQKPAYLELAWRRILCCREESSVPTCSNFPNSKSQLQRN